MEGVIMAPYNNTRLKSRLRNNTGRNTKNRQLFNRNHNNINNHKNSQRNNSSGGVLYRSNSLKNYHNNNNNKRHLNNINNVIYNIDNNDNGDSNGNELRIWAGDFTREVYNAICPRLGHTLHIPEDSIQALFNEMHLYPSKTQVSEMLQCARQCGRRNEASKYLTFGEFCVFVREMQHRKNQCNSKTNNTKCEKKCQVFLGGSCNPTTWRQDTAIPELQRYGITYYNPQVAMWAPELIALEHDAKQSASVLLFVVDNETRSTSGMIEAAYLVACGRCVVLVAHPYRPGQRIMGETISQREYRDLMESQSNLLLLVKSRGIKVHTNLTSALQCTANILKNTTSNGITAEEQIMNKLRQLRRIFDSYGGQNGDIKLYNALEAFKQLTKRDLKHNEIKDMFDYLNLTDDDITNATISFERFCVLIAEFTTDHCSNLCSTVVTTTTSSSSSSTTTTTTTTDAWVTQPFQRQCSTNNNTCNLLNNHEHLMNGNNDEYERNLFNRQQQQDDNNTQQQHYDVYLGGTRNSQQNWRRDIAIPILKKHGITYYNPPLRDIDNYEILDNISNNFIINNNNNNKNITTIDGNNDDILKWKLLIDRSKVLLFVVTNDTKSLTTMILAAYYIGLGRQVVLCVQRLPENNCIIHNETLSLQAIKDYNRGREYLIDLAKRRTVPVFEDITEAVQCVVDLYQSG